MIAEFLSKTRAELESPFLKRRIKRKLIGIKDSYIEDFKEHPKDYVMGALIGASLCLAWYYRQRAKQYEGFWVEFRGEWLDALGDGELVGFRVLDGKLCAKTFSPSSIDGA